MRVSDGTAAIRKVIRCLCSISTTSWQSTAGGGPAFVSLDTQGFELPILKSIDYRRFRPEIICVETLITGTNHMIPEIAAFMRDPGLRHSRHVVGEYDLRQLEDNLRRRAEIT